LLAVSRAGGANWRGQAALEEEGRGDEIQWSLGKAEWPQKNQEPSATDLALGPEQHVSQGPRAKIAIWNKTANSGILRISAFGFLSTFGFRIRVSAAVIFENRLTRDLLKGFAFIQGQSLWPTLMTINEFSVVQAHQPKESSHEYHERAAGLSPRVNPGHRLSMACPPLTPPPAIHMVNPVGCGRDHPFLAHGRATEFTTPDNQG